jgi:hypothetical protein
MRPNVAASRSSAQITRSSNGPTRAVSFPFYTRQKQALLLQHHPLHTLRNITNLIFASLVLAAF